MGIWHEILMKLWRIFKLWCEINLVAIYSNDLRYICMLLIVKIIENINKFKGLQLVSTLYDGTEIYTYQ